MPGCHVLALDLGSSGVRSYLGVFDGSRLDLTLIHEQANGPVRVSGHWYWNILGLHETILAAMREAARRTGGRPFTVGIETWGVDFGLIDSRGELLSPVYHYRDPRTHDLFPEVFERISDEALYAVTGVPSLAINTLVQLYWTATRRPWIVEHAESLLFTPDLLTYFLTRERRNELTIASTSQLLDPKLRQWAEPVIEKLGFPRRLFQPIVFPGQWSASLLRRVQEDHGLPDGISVISVASHDTACAVAATPMTEAGHSVFLSAGTWALLGIELPEPIRTPESHRAGFTNELGVDGVVLFHQVLSGLWLLQECRREWMAAEGRTIGYDELDAAACQAPARAHLFNPQEGRFLSPLRMAAEIGAWFKERGLPAPSTRGELVRAMYDSLALSYRHAIDQLERVTGERITTIHLVGGGARSRLFCETVANATGRQVVAGPATATALGNALLQLIAQGEIADLRQGREVIRASCSLAVYEPAETSAWQEAYDWWLHNVLDAK